MNSSALWAIVGILVLAGLGFWFYSAQAPTPATAPTAETTPTTEGSSGDTGVGASAGVDVGIGDASAPMSATVTLGPNGFTPSEVRIAKGGTVQWVNSSDNPMWVASAQHPTHTVYSGTTLAQHCDDATDASFDQCKNSGSYSFTFTKTGTWAYHNHSVNGQFGRVIVVE